MKRPNPHMAITRAKFYIAQEETHLNGRSSMWEGKQNECVTMIDEWFALIINHIVYIHIIIRSWFVQYDTSVQLTVKRENDCIVTEQIIEPTLSLVYYAILIILNHFLSCVEQQVSIVYDGPRSNNYHSQIVTIKHP